MPFASINPCDGRLIRRYPAHSATDLRQALATAQAGYETWRATSLAHRARVLRALSRSLLTHRDRLAALITTEMGKPIKESRAEIEKCAAACRYYAIEGPGHLRAEVRPGAPQGSFVAYQPLGVLLAIMPWNFPFWQVFRHLAPALLAGNTVLLKHAPSVSGCAIEIEALVQAAAGATPLLQAVRAEVAALPGLIADPRIRAVALTGSTRAGREVAALAGRALKPCVLELGGTDSYVVLADADVAHAARTLATGRLINGGQSCVAAKRMIVVESVRAQFEAALVEAFAQRRLGRPQDDGVDLGPMARADLRATVHRQVQRSVRAGARLLLGGRLPRGAGFFYPATVLTHVAPGMPASAEEVFGPVAAIIPVADEAAALAAAKDTPYGLGAGVFTRNRRHGRQLAVTQLEAGMVCVNDFVRSDPSLPFGGIKDSGLGRELGREGIRSLTNIKTIRVC